MCSLQEHAARSAREHEAQAQEPLYTALAKERGIEWVDLPPAEEPEEIRAAQFREPIRTVYISNDDLADITEVSAQVENRLRFFSQMGAI